MAEQQSCELMKSRELEIEIGWGEDEAFHFEELRNWVETITKINVLFCLKSMDLVVLAGHKERGHPQQLEVMFGNKGALEN